VRSPRLIRHLPVDHWVVTHLLRGTTSIETPRGTIDIEQGQTYIWSLGQKLSSARSKVERLDLLLSRDTFRDIAPLLDAATGSALVTPLGRLLGNFLVSLMQRMPGLPDSDAPQLTIAIGKLVAACVAPSAKQVEAARVFLDIGRLERVRQTVRAHLQSPLLGPQMLCRQVGMSRSNLYRLLESEGGVTSYTSAIGWPRRALGCLTAGTLNPSVRWRTICALPTPRVSVGLFASGSASARVNCGLLPSTGCAAAASRVLSTATLRQFWRTVAQPLG
jgi:hypothetical protein